MRKPKSITLTFEPWPDPKPRRHYTGQVIGIRESGNCISVTVENLDKTMAGRLHQADLPNSLHPSNRTHRFAAAAGLDVDTFGDQIDLRAAMGQIVGMRFLPVGDGYEIDFEKVPDQAEYARKKSPEHNDPPSDTGWDR